VTLPLQPAAQIDSCVGSELQDAEGGAVCGFGIGCIAEALVKRRIDFLAHPQLLRSDQIPGHGSETSTVDLQPYGARAPWVVLDGGDRC
jgi:hypothetical protein